MQTTQWGRSREALRQSLTLVALAFAALAYSASHAAAHNITAGDAGYGHP